MRRIDDFNTMSLDGLNIYLDTVQNLEELEEFTLKNICYLAKNLINSIRRGRITINNTQDEKTIELWEEAIARCFDICEETVKLINDKLAFGEVVPSEKPGIISLLSDYIKCLNEEEARLIKIEKKQLEENPPEEDIVLDGVPLSDIVEEFAPV